MCEKPQRDDAMQNPAEYLDQPIEQWTVRQLTAALGTQRTATLLGVDPGNVRVIRHRNTLRLERVQALQAAVVEDLPNIRSNLATLYTLHTTRNSRPTKEESPT